MVEERHRRRLHIAKVVLFSLAPAMVLLAVAEASAALSIRRRVGTISDATTGQRVYIMRIGNWPWSRRAVTPLNSLGFPDEEFPPANAMKTCRHVAFAGDSYVFGDGVSRDSNFVEIVRRRIARTSGEPCVRVFNIAERGTTIDRQLRRVVETMDRLKPDIVILGQYQNDLTDLTSPGAILGPLELPSGQARPRTIHGRLPALNVSTVKLLAYRSMAVMIQRGITRDELRHWSVVADTARQAEAVRLQQVYTRLYEQLATTLAQRGVGFGVVIIPSKLDVLAARYPEESFFLSLAGRHNVPSLRMYPVFHAHRTPYAFLMYDGHLSEQGNRLVAAELQKWLFESEPAPFPILRQPVPMDGAAESVTGQLRAGRESPGPTSW